MRFATSLVLLVGFVGLSSFADEVIQVKPQVGCACSNRGLILPHDIKDRHAKSWARHRHHLEAMPHADVTSFDCRTAGWVPDFDNQGQCGSCWIFSGADTIAAAFIKGNYGRLTISKQQLLDCHFRDGCSGGFPEDVAKVAKSQGVVTDVDYGVSYRASPGQCKKIDPSKILKIADYGFCSQGDGVASYADFKKCMLKYGVISLCYDADGTPQSGPNGPVWKGTGGRNIDHAIKAIAFDDSKSPKGAVLCWNQWFGDDRDYWWAEWGANGIGNSAMWVSVDPLPGPGPGPTPAGGYPNPWILAEVYAITGLSLAALAKRGASKTLAI